MSEEITLKCQNVTFVSLLDQQTFEEWLGRLEHIEMVEKKANNFYLLKINTQKAFSSFDFGDFLSLFERYQIDKKQLFVFKNKETLHWFSNPRWTQEQCFCIQEDQKRL